MYLTSSRSCNRTTTRLILNSTFQNRFEAKFQKLIETRYRTDIGNYFDMDAAQEKVKRKMEKKREKRMKKLKASDSAPDLGKLPEIDDHKVRKESIVLRLLTPTVLNGGLVEPHCFNFHEKLSTVKSATLYSPSSSKFPTPMRQQFPSWSHILRRRRRSTNLWC
jgi:hypothetical protein